MTDQHYENLFSYGTLQDEAVQIATFGRRLRGMPDTLKGYVLGKLTITNPDVVGTSGIETHPVIRKAKIEDESALVEGKVFQLTPEELRQADIYEESDYDRVMVNLESGAQSWVYIDAKDEAA